MPWAFVDSVLACLGIALTCAAVLFMADGVLGGPLTRQRRTRQGRCGQCGYELAGLARCPECGESSARRGNHWWAWRRIWWRRLGQAAMLGVAGWCVFRLPDVRQQGPARFVPTAVMVLLPMDVEACVCRDGADWVGQDLASRGMSSLGRWESRVLAWRLARQWRANAEPGVVVVIADGSGAGEAWRTIREKHRRIFGDAPMDSWAGGSPRCVGTTVLYALDLDCSIETRGSRGDVVAIGPWLVVQATPGRLERGLHVLRILENYGTKHLDSTAGDILVFDGSQLRYHDEDDLRDLRLCIDCDVNSEKWLYNGGNESHLIDAGVLIMMVGPPEMKERVLALVDAIRQADAGKAVRLPAYVAKGNDGIKVEYIALWPAEKTLRAWGLSEVDDVDFDQVLREYEEHREAQSDSPDTHHKYVSGAFERLERSRLRGLLENSSDDEARVSKVGTVLILFTHSPELINQVEEALRDATDGPTAMSDIKR